MLQREHSAILLTFIKQPVVIETFGLSIFEWPCVKGPLSKRQKKLFLRLSLNAGQIYCRMLQREHSVILLIFIKLPVVIETFVLSIFEWPFYTGFIRERSSSVVECLTRVRGAAGSSLTSVTALFP